MHRATLSTSRTLALSALISAMAGCALSGPTTTGVDQPLKLSGELTTRSPVNVKDGSRYQSFPLQLNAGEVIEVRQQGEMASHLSLLDADNRLINGPGESALTLVPSRSGRHTLTFSGATASQYGPFNLSLAKVNVRNGGTIVSGERLAGLLISATGNRYELQVDEAAIYSIRLSSDQFDTKLGLSGEGVNVENDDANNSTNSRIDAYLTPGSYQLLSTALNESPNGTYVLAVEHKPVPGNITLVNGGTLHEDSRITGLASAAPLHYRLQLSQPGLVTLTMSSSEVDSQLNLTGNNLDVSDDDGAGNGHDARITQLLEAGEYQVAASSIDGRAGLFTLSYSQTPAVRGSLGQLQPGQYATGNLGSSRPATAMLRVSEPGQYLIDLTSSDFDAVLRVEGDDIDAEDDDSGGARNARLSLHLEPGDYRLQVRSVDQSNRGRFMISVQSQN